MTATVEELAPRTEDEVRAHLAAGKLVEGLQHMSPEYLKGIRRILTVSADTELVSAPAYLRAAAHAPALNNFGSAVSIIQDELAHAHIGYRLLGDLGVDMPALIYEREAKAFKYPYAFDVPLDSWYEMVLANALYDQAGFVLLSDVHQHSTFGPVEARAGQGRQGGDLPPAPRAHVGEEARRRPGRQEAKLQASLDWMFILTLEWFGLPDARKKHGIQLEYGFKGKSNDELRQDWMGHVVPFMEEVGLEVPAHYDEATERYVIDTPVPARVRLRDEGAGATRSRWDEVHGPLEGPRADERDLRREAAEGLPRMTADRRGAAVAGAAGGRGSRDPDLGRRHGADRRPLAFDDGIVDLKLTFTAMGCPAMDFIQDDIRERLLQEPEVDEVRIEIVWDPVWTRKMIREEARETMRGLGIVA